MIPLDFCVSVQGPMAKDLMRLFLGSLVRHCRTDGVKFHFVCRNGNSWTADNPYLKELDWNVRYLSFAHTQDVNYCADWMLKNCGTEKWACLSHFDMWFKKDWLTYAREHTADDVALVGVHCPIMLINRDAYAQSVVKFNTMDGFCAVPLTDSSRDWKLRHRLDPRSAGGLPVRGFDTGELLELEMRSRGWKVHPLNVYNEEESTEEGHPWFKHIGGGGTHTSEAEVAAKLKLCHETVVEHGY